jgi:hypothetical protein
VHALVAFASTGASAVVGTTYLVRLRVWVCVGTGEGAGLRANARVCISIGTMDE